MQQGWPGDAGASGFEITAVGCQEARQGSATLRWQSPIPMTRVSLPPLLLASALAALVPGAVQAELPPWVYGEQQRQAPVVLRLTVKSATRAAGDLELRCRVLQVVRQPSSGQLRSGQTVLVRYPAPPSRSPAMLGPSPLPALSPGTTVTAWLTPLSGRLGTFAPAAGGRSFGPAMEDAMEPAAAP